MLQTLSILIGWTLILGVSAFAWLRGGPVEKWGATLNVVASACGLLAQATLPNEPKAAVLLMCDGAFAFGLLLLAVRYVTLWVGVAMILQAIQFILHTYYFVMELRHDRLYVIINDSVSLGVLACIVWGVVSWRRRSRAPAAAA